jgi:cyclohexa-1,5-dienecarbonyl-CoA hydratase
MNAEPDRVIQLDREGEEIAWIRIRRPPVNALRVADLERIAEKTAEIGRARVLVLEGLPNAFSAGVDVAEHVPEQAAIDRMLAAMRAVLTALAAAPAVTIASVSGACLGGGAEVAAACDLWIAAEDARIGFPEIRLACFPPGAAALLPIRVPLGRAADWILSGRVLSGREAKECGLLTHCCTPEALATETRRKAAEIASRSAEALAGALELLREPLRRALDRPLAQAEQAYRRLAGNAELAKAVANFRKS